MERKQKRWTSPAAIFASSQQQQRQHLLSEAIKEVDEDDDSSDSCGAPESDEEALVVPAPPSVSSPSKRTALDGSKRASPSKAQKRASHSILVVDHSGSMRTEDALDPKTGKCITRRTAVFDALQTDFIIPQKKVCTPKCLLTLVTLGEKSDVLPKIPFSQCAQQLAYWEDRSDCRGEGNYLPAITVLKHLLEASSQESHSVNVLFFSDGIPSDTPPKGPGKNSKKLQTKLVDSLKAAFQPYLGPGDDRLSFKAIGFGNADFATLIAMQEVVLPGLSDRAANGHSGAAKVANVVTALTTTALKTSLAEFSSQVTESRLVGSSAVRAADPHRRRERPFELLPEDTPIDDITWAKFKNVKAFSAPAGLTNPIWEDKKNDEGHNQFQVEVSSNPFGRGGERNVFHMRVLGDSLRGTTSSQFNLPLDFVASADVVMAERKSPGWKSLFQEVIAIALGVGAAKVGIELQEENLAPNSESSGKLLKVQANIELGSSPGDRENMQQIMHRVDNKAALCNDLQSELRHRGYFDDPSECGRVECMTVRKVGYTQIVQDGGESRRWQSAKPARFDQGWVAKENRYLEGDFASSLGEVDRQKAADLEFHQKNLVTQVKARGLAHKFSEAIELHNFAVGFAKYPKAEYTDCFLLEIKTKDSATGIRNLFVETKLQEKPFRKWNSNFGAVATTGAVAEVPGVLKFVSPNREAMAIRSAPRYPGSNVLTDSDLLSGTETRFVARTKVLYKGTEIIFYQLAHDRWIHDYDKGSPGNRLVRVIRQASSAADSGVPQAFSHWTYEETRKKLLVCDIQGVFSARKKRFIWVDPVIHSMTKCQYGRTDHGIEGIDRFFASHQCNAICRSLRLPANKRFAGAPSASGVSRNTSQITVSQTKHLRERKTERVISTRECQGAVKHGLKVPQHSGRIKHCHNDVAYITDKAGKKGITAFRPSPAAAANQKPVARGGLVPRAEALIRRFPPRPPPPAKRSSSELAAEAAAAVAAAAAAAAWCAETDERADGGWTRV